MELLEYRTVERWMGRQADSANSTNRSVIRGFFYFLGETEGKWGSLNPDEIIEYQRQANSEPNGRRFELLDLLQDFVDSKDLRYNSKVRYYSTIRSFFAHNRAELPPDKRYSISSNVPPVEGKLTAEEVRNMILSSKPVYQAIISSILVAGLDQEMFMYWNLNGWASLKKAIEENAKIVRIDLPGRKKMKFKSPYYTFIGGDALDLVRRYIENFRPESDEGIFFDQRKKPLAKTALASYWRRHATTIGLWDPVENAPKSLRHGKGLHEIRDVFRTLWERSPSTGTAGEFFMGHIVDKLGYNKIMKDEKWARREYMRALPFLNIMSEDKAYGKVDEDELDTLRRENKILREQTAQQGQLRDQKIADLEEQLRQLREEMIPLIEEKIAVRQELLKGT